VLLHGSGDPDIGELVNERASRDPNGFPWLDE